MTNQQFAPFRGRGRLTDLVTELRRQVESRNDFVADTRDLRVAVVDGNARLVPEPSAQDFLPRDGVPFLDQALTQLGGRTTPAVPVKFLKDAIAKAPQRTADFLTGILHDNSKRNLVRVLDGNVRAFLSDRFRAYESLDIVSSVLQAAQDQPCKILEASVSDSHVRIKLINPHIHDALTVNNPGGHQFYTPDQLVTRANTAWLQRAGIDPNSFPDQAGPETLWPVVTFSNSETGHGRYVGSVGFLVRVCFNLAIAQEEVSHVHLGQRLDSGIFAPETIDAEARAISLKTRDVIGAAFNQDKFRALCAGFKESDNKPVTAPSTAAKNVIGLTTALGETDLDALVNAFTQERRSVWGLGQAVARLAQDTNNPEVAAEREVFAGRILAGKHDRAILAAGKV